VPDYAWVDSAIRGIAVPVVIAVAFRWFARRFPPSKKAIEFSISTEEPVSGWWTGLSIVLWLGSIGVIMLGTVASTRALNDVIALIQGPAEFRLVPTWAWWYLYGGFAGLSLSWLVIAPAMRFLMTPDKFARWTRGHDRQAGFDTERAMRFLALAIMGPYTLAFLPSVGCHTRFSEGDIGIQTYAQIREVRYGYGDVAATMIVKGGRDRSGEFYKDPQIVIDFKDGRRWSSGDGFRDPEDINPDLAAFIAIKTGLAFRYIEAKQDLR